MVYLTVLIIIIVVIFLIWRQIKWEEFTLNKGDSIVSQKNVLFSSCYFYVNTHKQNITGVLRHMQSKFGNVVLWEPLNGMSFVVPGVNDRKTLTSAREAQTWARSAQIKLTGFKGTLFG